MKVLTYNLLQGIDENDNPILMRVEMGWNETNEEIAKCEAYNGEYTIEDDGQPEPESQPTTDERLTELEEAFQLLLSGVTE